MHTNKHTSGLLGDEDRQVTLERCIARLIETGLFATHTIGNMMKSMDKAIDVVYVEPRDECDLDLLCDYLGVPPDWASRVPYEYCGRVYCRDWVIDAYQEILYAGPPFYDKVVAFIEALKESARTATPEEHQGVPDRHRKEAT